MANHRPRISQRQERRRGYTAPLPPRVQGVSGPVGQRALIRQGPPKTPKPAVACLGAAHAAFLRPPHCSMLQSCFFQKQGPKTLPCLSSELWASGPGLAGVLHDGGRLTRNRTQSRWTRRRLLAQSESPIPHSRQWSSIILMIDHWTRLHVPIRHVGTSWPMISHGPKQNSGSASDAGYGSRTGQVDAVDNLPRTACAQRFHSNRCK